MYLLRYSLVKQHALNPGLRYCNQEVLNLEREAAQQRNNKDIKRQEREASVGMV
jgi:hypothetical protein